MLEQKEDLRVNVEDNWDAKIAKKLAINCGTLVHLVDISMKVVVQMLEGEGDKLTTPPKFLIHLLLQALQESIQVCL